MGFSHLFVRLSIWPILAPSFKTKRRRQAKRCVTIPRAGITGVLTFSLRGQVDGCTVCCHCSGRHSPLVLTLFCRVFWRCRTVTASRVSSTGLSVTESKWTACSVKVHSITQPTTSLSLASTTWPFQSMYPCFSVQSSVIQGCHLVP